ncbi:MAG: DUF3795 domain-containing protein [Calditrichaeota bacterium]|jgi:hypothetical protein|nr:DUF3795 domain-containing protein [Calditrichota bacterium]
MPKLISMCGIDCSTCEAYMATKKNDDGEREKVAISWSKQYNAEIKTSDVNCDGCMADGGAHFMHCNMCEIRKCGVDRGLENCAHCDDYVCEQLGNFFKMVPVCKENLDEVRKGI